jgi:threonine dehydratase
MRLLVKNSHELEKLIDPAYGPEHSIVLRYRKACHVGEHDMESRSFREWLLKTSIREGARICPLMTYHGVHIHILDETTHMFTKTLKSIDGCVSIAHCKSKGYDGVVFESGGNTGAALTAYGQRIGMETFFFCPEENLSLLNSKTFQSDSTHLISVEDPGMVKEAAGRFEKMTGLKHIPETDWRYHASMFRGLFILEEMLQKERFSWIIQTVSAAFGPIGIYRVLHDFVQELGERPRFLGIQQEMNCPMYKAWKEKKREVTPEPISSTGQLLTRVMYDAMPHSYGTFRSLNSLLTETRGGLDTINHREFKGFLGRPFDGKGILELLRNRGIEITRSNEDILEKTGLLALAGTLKAVDQGRIPPGDNVLCCLTSGAGVSDGRAKAEFRITNLDQDLIEYTRSL